MTTAKSDLSLLELASASYGLSGGLRKQKGFPSLLHVIGFVSKQEEIVHCLELFWLFECQKSAANMSKASPQHHEANLKAISCTLQECYLLLKNNLSKLLMESPVSFTGRPFEALCTGGWAEQSTEQTRFVRYERQRHRSMKTSSHDNICRHVHPSTTSLYAQLRMA